MHHASARSTVTAPDVVVTWLQNDYGQLGRAAESIAHALQRGGLARQVAYLEPNLAGPGAPRLECLDVAGLHVYRQSGGEISGTDLANAVEANSGLIDPVLLNVGVAEINWWFHHAFGPVSSRSASVVYDMLHLWPGIDPAASRRLARVRKLLLRSSDVVLGLSTGSIADCDGATYVGHGCDPGIDDPAVDDLPEPADLAAIGRPRALYFGALSVRVDAAALAALARTGVQVVLVGIAPAPAIAELIDAFDNVHFLGSRPPGVSAAYLRHCDLGVVPHTDEPFTWSMEPHKVYNYACAGLRSVLLNCACPPALVGAATSTADVDSFVDACLSAMAQGRLDPANRAVARAQTWEAVAARIMASVNPDAAHGPSRSAAHPALSVR